MREAIAPQQSLAGLKHLTDQEKAALLEFVARLRERYGEKLELIMLFGSKVRGDFDEESDLDVLVVVESDGWRFHREISSIGSRVSLDYDVNISPKAVTQAHYRDLQELRTPFFENVQAEGVELWRRKEGGL
ncbi:MAG TPA: nucleotidyltransferase domain-containing protein [Anaerolineae bacterium]|nr:nucleotidyltransferase domain-containing protein [Anaerolineae bacterium]